MPKTIKKETIQQFKQNKQNITTKKQAKHLRTINDITQSKTIQNVPRKKKNTSTTKTKNHTIKIQQTKSTKKLKQSHKFFKSCFKKSNM
jgi:hypothetical protein